jgi:hypothetical protein
VSLIPVNTARYFVAEGSEIPNTGAMRRTPPILAIAVAATLAGLAVGGPDVDESTSVRPDAGSTTKTAKVAKGNGTVSSALGATSVGVLAGDSVDMFLVQIANTTTFSATIATPASFDTQLFLFRLTPDSTGELANAFAMVANDDALANSGWSRITFPSPSNYGPGTYAIAVAPRGVRPFSYSIPSGTGGPGTRTPTQMFTTNLVGAQTPVVTTAPLRTWDGAPTGAGPYVIQFTGCTLIPLGIGPDRCGDVFSGSCFEAHTLPACDDEQCCRTVCSIDPYCCTTSWDANCANVAQQNCPACGTTQNTCSGDLNADGIVNGADLGGVLMNWGQCN